MGKRRGRNNDNKEKEKKNYKRLSNKLESATDKAKKEYLESICDEIMELERTWRYDMLCMKIKECGWEDNRVNQNISIETLKGRSIVDQKEVRKFGRIT
jgi:hypothetical protein